MLVECPYCFRRVNPSEDGSCPRCNADVTDLSNVNPKLSPVSIKNGATLPDACCHCGTTTERRHTVIQDGAFEAVGDDNRSSGGFLLLGLWGLVFTAAISGAIRLLMRNSSSRPSYSSIRMKFEIPQCELCSENIIDPISTDFERGIIRIVVTSEFKLGYEKLNSDVPSFLRSS